jgi:hypothetical protein
MESRTACHTEAYTVSINRPDQALTEASSGLLLLISRIGLWPSSLSSPRVLLSVRWPRSLGNKRSIPSNDGEMMLQLGLLTSGEAPSRLRAVLVFRTGYRRSPSIMTGGQLPEKLSFRSFTTHWDWSVLPSTSLCIGSWRHPHAPKHPNCLP